MPSSSRDDYQMQRRRNMYGYCGRTVITLIGVASILCSLYASTTCDFISYESLTGSPQETLEPPFDRAVKANVGIFQYKILEVEGRVAVDEECDVYDSLFQDMADDYPSLTSAQFCALIAPVAAALALFLNFFECFCCSFYASFLLTGFLFLSATGIQAGTFSLVADPDFCFSDNQECEQKEGVYFGIAATAGFFVAATLLCCMPRPDPCCYANLQNQREEQHRASGRTNLSQPNNGSGKQQPPKRRPSPAIASPVSPSPPPKRRNSRQPSRGNSSGGGSTNNNRASTRRKKANRTNSASFSDEEQSTSRQEQYASSRGRSSDSSQSDYSDDDEQRRPIPRHSSRMSGSHHSRSRHTTSSDADFDTNVPPPRNVSHMETTEKLFPDGSKQVTETTHFTDGSKAVKTRVFGAGEYDDDDSFADDDAASNKNNNNSDGDDGLD